MGLSIATTSNNLLNYERNNKQNLNNVKKFCKQNISFKSLSVIFSYCLFYMCTVFLLLTTFAIALEIDRKECGETKGCLFKPAGCDPQLDCTIGIFNFCLFIFYFNYNI